MDGVEISEVVSDFDESASQIFSDFMLRITKFEDLVSVGSSFFGGFRQHVELLRKRPLEISEVVDGVLKANQTARVKAYIKGGCINVNEGVQSVSKLNECQIGLQEHINRAKELLNEVECLMDSVLKVLHSVSETTFKYEVKHPNDDLLVHQAKLEKTDAQIKMIEEEVKFVQNKMKSFKKRDKIHRNILNEQLEQVRENSRLSKAILDKELQLVNHKLMAFRVYSCANGTDQYRRMSRK